MKLVLEFAFAMALFVTANLLSDTFIAGGFAGIIYMFAADMIDGVEA